MVSSAYVWAKIYGYMEDQLGSIVISTFFDDVEIVDLTQDTGVFLPEPFKLEFIGMYTHPSYKLRVTSYK